jgi:hypothetical protein
MTKYCTVFLLLLVISACHNGKEQPFPVPYKWKDTVIDYTFTGKELKLSFPGGSLSKDWLFEIEGRYDSTYFLYIKPAFYHSDNNQFIIPVTKSDSLAGKKVKFILRAAPGDCSLWYKTKNGKYFSLGREFYCDSNDQFHLDPDVMKREWISFPDSLTHGKDSTDYQVKMAEFLHDNIDDPLEGKLKPVHDPR